MNTQTNKFHLSFIIAIVLVFIVAIFSYSKIISLVTSATLVNQTKQITFDLEKISGSLTDAETAQRGYLLTKDKIFLEPFNKGLKEYPQYIKALQQFSFDNPEQKRRLVAIETLAQRRKDYMHKILEVDKLRTPTVKELLKGKSIMDSLQNAINTMIASEESILEITTNEHKKQTVFAPLKLLILSLLALATIFTIYWKLNKSLTQARQLKADAIQQAVAIEATREIQESEKKYNMMLMKSPFCFGVIKGENMIITFANNAIKEVWAKGNEIEGKPFLEILPELINTAFPSLIQKVMTTGVPYYGYDMLAQLNKNGKLEDGYFNFVYQPYYETENIISGVTIIAIDVTKEVIAKKQVEEVEMRFRKTVEKAPVAICVLRGQYHVVEVINEKNLEILGRTKEQVLNKPIFTAVPEGAKQGYEEILNSVFTTGKTYIANEQPVTLIHNGKEESMYLNITYEALYDKENKIDGVISVAIDVAEQVIARKKIEESDIFKRTVLESSKDCVKILDLEGKLTFINSQGICALEGNRKEDYLNRKWETLWEAENQQLIVDAVAKATRGELSKFIAFAPTEKGTPKWWDVIVTPIINKDGKVISILATSRDITNQKQQQQEIEESKQRFEAAIEVVQGIVWTNNAKGKMEGEQKGWQELTGQAYEEYHGYGWAKAVHPDDAQPTIDAWNIALKEVSTFSFEHRVKVKGVGYRYFSIKAIPLLNSDGSIRQWVGVHTDIHDQKLRDEKKDEFISIASHELKTPLTTTKAYLQMLLGLALDENNEEAILYAKKANESVSRLNDLITELLDVSKIRLGKLNYTITAFNFNDMIETTVENVQLSSSTHKIIKTGKVETDVTGDKNRLQQVVINLLNNAIKYSPNAKNVYINIEQENDSVRVSVKDTGIGMSRQSLNKIFEKYHRIEEHAIHFQGLGIGLFISYEIIERHHGKLWAESEAGKGSTFYFTIPLNFVSTQ